MPKGHKGGFYAVKVGREPGVYEQWPDALKQVNGFSGAKHKKFRTREDAQAYVNGTSGSSSRTSSTSSSGSSSRSSSTSSAAKLPSSTSARGSKPYDRPVKKSKTSHAGAQQASAKQPYQYKRLEMQWTRQIEAELIKDGWLVAFTDGACSSNGKAGAAAAAGVFWSNPRTLKPISERVPGKQTNQCAELYAILRALETDPDPSKPLHIFTDSSYSIQCLTEWMTIWINRGWKTKEGEPVLNVELLKLIHFMISKREGPVELSWVKGHSNVPGNKAADKLAVQGLGRDMPHCRNFDAEREERSHEYRQSKRSTPPQPIQQQISDDNIDESWVLDADEELAELDSDSG